MFKKQFLIFTVLVCFFSFNIQAFAEAAKDDETVEEWINSDQKTPEQSPSIEDADAIGQNTSSLAFPFIKMLFALAVIVCLIYALAKFINKRTKAYSGNRAIETVGGVSVGHNRSIQLVKVGNRLLVVGVGESIQLLKELTDENEIEKLIQDQEANLGYENILTKPKQWFEKSKSSNSEKFTTMLDRQLQKMTENRKQVYDDVMKKESRNE